MTGVTSMWLDFLEVPLSISSNGRALFLNDFQPFKRFLSVLNDIQVQGTPYVFWTNSVCFPRPGTTDQEVIKIIILKLCKLFSKCKGLQQLFGGVLLEPVLKFFSFVFGNSLKECTRCAYVTRLKLYWVLILEIIWRK